MDSNALTTYWETQVLTASPQKLRLMLIDGAIRYSRLVLQLWGENKFDEAFPHMMRAQNVVIELLTSIQPNGSELNKTIASLYLFIYKSLVNAQLKRDPQGINDALRVLAEERETWRQVCEINGHKPSQSEFNEFAPKEITARNSPAIHSAHFQPPVPNNAGFSIDA